MLKFNLRKAPIESRNDELRYVRDWALAALVLIVLVVLFFILGGFALLEAGNPDTYTNAPVTQPTQVPATNPATPPTPTDR